MKKSIHTAEYAALCDELRTARNNAGLSQRRLAARLRVSPSWVAKVEAGERRIDLVEFCRFMAACGGDAGAVFGRVAKLIPAARRERKGGRR